MFDGYIGSIVNYYFLKCGTQKGLNWGEMHVHFCKFILGVKKYICKTAIVLPEGKVNECEYSSSARMTLRNFFLYFHAAVGAKLWLYFKLCSYTTTILYAPFISWETVNLWLIQNPQKWPPANFHDSAVYILFLAFWNTTISSVIED